MRVVSTLVAPVLQPLLAADRLPIVFVVGFNKSGKSLIVDELTRVRRLSIYPGEGNDTLWFPGFYPRPAKSDLPPLWCDPERFTEEVVASRAGSFRAARAQLILYGRLRAPRRPLLNDSGMLAAILPHVMPDFRDAKIVHVIRDGRVVTHRAALRTVERMRAAGQDYGSVGCPTSLEAIAEAQARYWCWTLDRLQNVDDAYPGQVLSIRYEDWCADPGRVLSSIHRFVGLQPRPCQSVGEVVIKNTNAVELSAIPSKLLERTASIMEDHLVRHGYAGGHNEDV